MQSRGTSFAPFAGLLFLIRHFIRCTCLIDFVCVPRFFSPQRIIHNFQQKRVAKQPAFVVLYKMHTMATDGGASQPVGPRCCLCMFIYAHACCAVDNSPVNSRVLLRFSNREQSREQSREIYICTSFHSAVKLIIMPRG